VELGYFPLEKCLNRASCQIPEIKTTGDVKNHVGDLKSLLVFPYCADESRPGNADDLETSGIDFRGTPLGNDMEPMFALTDLKPAGEQQVYGAKLFSFDKVKMGEDHIQAVREFVPSSTSQRTNQKADDLSFLN
jgi:hypothetical protein